MPAPTESSVVIVRGAFGIVWRGELIMMTGSDTVNTQMALTDGLNKEEQRSFGLYCGLTVENKYIHKFLIYSHINLYSVVAIISI